MLQRLRAINRNQKGFTLIEVLVVVAITGMIGAGSAMAVTQVMTVNAASTNHVIAVKQVENAAYWITHDVRMAQIVQPTGGSGFPLSLSWVEWDNTTHQVSYAINNNELLRSSSINGTPPMQMAVARYISSDANSTSCQYANGVLAYKLTSLVTGFKQASETRMAQVIPRSAQ
jgi:prepilin-type N-terminal cleavage/methylation domain-containing protein